MILPVRMIKQSILIIVQWYFAELGWLWWQWSSSAPLWGYREKISISSQTRNHHSSWSRCLFLCREWHGYWFQAGIVHARTHDSHNNDDNNRDNNNHDNINHKDHNADNNDMVQCCSCLEKVCFTCLSSIHNFAGPVTQAWGQTLWNAIGNTILTPSC